MHEDLTFVFSFNLSCFSFPQSFSLVGYGILASKWKLWEAPLRQPMSASKIGNRLPKVNPILRSWWPFINYTCSKLRTPDLLRVLHSTLTDTPSSSTMWKYCGWIYNTEWNKFTTCKWVLIIAYFRQNNNMTQGRKRRHWSLKMFFT